MAEMATDGAQIRAPRVSVGETAPDLARRPRHRRGRLMRRALLATDLIALVVAFSAAQLLSPAGPRGFAAAGDYLVLIAVLAGWFVVAELTGMYDRDEELTRHGTTDELGSVLHIVTLGVWSFYVAAWLVQTTPPPVSRMVSFWGLAILLVLIGRSSARAWCRRRLAYLQNTIVVGAGDVGQQVARKLLRHPEYGINLLGFVDSKPLPRQDGLDELPLLGVPEALPELVRALGVERVIIAFSKDSPEQTLALLRDLDDVDVQIDVVPRLFELVSPSVQMDTIEGLPLVALPPRRISRLSFLIKRTIDIAGATVVLVVTAPLFAYIAWRIKRDSTGPVFFRQTRLGLNMREFTALKFRTMRTDVDTAEHEAYISRLMDPRQSPTGTGFYKLGGDAITPFGRVLRRTSLDELPQLINVLRGDMSLVGPRPCIAYETKNFLPYHFERFLVPAGLTGLWQVTARAHSSFKEALDMDVAYARGWSLGLDLRLLCRTPIEAFGRRATA
jgi:exopolysaccharide biosynthesis polyprenyl glycosylphosphotransferase